jgi:hypothetical protein
MSRDRPALPHQGRHPQHAPARGRDLRSVSARCLVRHLRQPASSGRRGRPAYFCNFGWVSLHGGGSIVSGGVSPAVSLLTLCNRSGDQRKPAPRSLRASAADVPLQQRARGSNNEASTAPLTEGSLAHIGGCGFRVSHMSAILRAIFHILEPRQHVLQLAGLLLRGSKARRLSHVRGLAGSAGMLNTTASPSPTAECGLTRPHHHYPYPNDNTTASLPPTGRPPHALMTTLHGPGGRRRGDDIHQPPSSNNPRPSPTPLRT